MSQELTVKNDNAVASADIFSDFQAFENAQRIGKLLCQSKIIPGSYQNNLPDVIVALEIAARNKLSPIVVMQNLNVIKGRPTWSSKYIIAALTTSRVDNLHYEMSSNGTVSIGGFNSKETIENLCCRAIANDKRTGEERIGPWVTMRMVVAEGWYNKDGSKWKTMPEVMIRYRAATFFASIYYPELSIGIDEDDTPATPQNMPAKAEPVAGGEIVEPQAEAPVAKPKRAKKAEPKTPEAKTPEPETKEPEPVEAEFEEVDEGEAPKPAPVAAPQADDSDEWNNWGD